MQDFSLFQYTLFSPHFPRLVLRIPLRLSRGSVLFHFSLAMITSAASILNSIPSTPIMNLFLTIFASVSSDCFSLFFSAAFHRVRFLGSMSLSFSEGPKSPSILQSPAIIMRDKALPRNPTDKRWRTRTQAVGPSHFDCRKGSLQLNINIIATKTPCTTRSHGESSRYRPAGRHDKVYNQTMSTRARRRIDSQKVGTCRWWWRLVPRQKAVTRTHPFPD